MIIGIDPSLTGTAICTQEGDDPPQFELISTEKDKDLPPSVDYTFRLMKIRDGVRAAVENVKKVEFAAIEGISFGSTGRLAELGGLSYFIREIFVEKKIPFIVIPPTVLKKYWCDKGNCAKIDMIKEALIRKIHIPYMKKYKGLELPDDNCVDSVAIVYFAKSYLNKELNGLEEKIERFGP